MKLKKAFTRALAGSAILASLSAAHPQATEAQSSQILFKGYVESSYYPPHNEFDPNPGIPFEDRVVARYGLEAYVEASSKSFLPRFFLFANPRLYLGDSRPQLDYNYRADPIVLNLIYGAGFRIRDNLDLRVSHGHWIDQGGYTRKERLIWNAVQLRWTFDGLLEIKPR